MLLADAHVAIPSVICTLLLIAVIVLFVLGLVEAFGVRRFTGSRYGALVGFLIALVLYIVLC